MPYFDYASTTYVYPEVIDKVEKVMKLCWGNPANLHQKGLEARRLVEEARAKIAKAIGAEPNEIIFTSCASESNALAINQFDRVICSPYEHHDIKENRKTGSGVVLYAHMLVNNETGEIFDIKKIVEEAHLLGMKVLVDGTQALGNIEIDVKDLDADFMSFSFHKVHAPKGVGALYVKGGALTKPLIFGSQEHGYRGGTSNVPGIVGAGMAVERAVSEIESKRAWTSGLREYVIEGLKDLPYMVVEGRNNIPSILNVCFKGVTGESIMLALDNKGIQVGTGSACNSGDHKPSDVLVAMRVPEEYIQGEVRISFDLVSGYGECDKLIEGIRGCFDVV